MRILYKIRGLLEKGEKAIIIVFLGLMILFVFLQTFIRALSSFINISVLASIASSFDWAMKVSYLLFVWVLFLGAAISTANRKHITIDILTKFVNKKSKLWLTLIADSLSLISILLFFIISLKWFLSNNYFIIAKIINFINIFGIEINIKNFYEPVKLIGVKFPAWTIDLAIPIGFMLIGYNFIINIIEDIIAIRNKNYAFLDKYEKEIYN